MNKFTLAIAFTFLFASLEKANAESVYASSMDISCNGFYKCLSVDEYRALAGKSLSYRHPGGVDFGDVTLDIRADGTASGKNKKGPAGEGPWEIKEGRLILKLSRWGDQLFQLIRIGEDQLFFYVNSGGRSYLVPVEVSK